MAQEFDVAVGDSDQGTSEVDPSVLANIENVLSGADPAEVAEAQGPTSDPPRNPAALRREAKQQVEELEEQAAAEASDEPAETEQEEPAVDEVEEPSTPAVDPNHREVAHQFGWTDERIDKLAAADPQLAADTLQALADTYTNLSRQYLQPAAPVQPAPQYQQPPAPQQASGLDVLFSPEQLRQFAETNGQEIVDKFLKPFAAERSAMQQEVARLTGFVQAQERQAVAAEANTAFAELSKVNGDLYGKDTAFSAVQKFAREQVAQVADQLRAGAKLQGRDLSVSEALKRAHLVLTGDRKTAEGRKAVTEQVQKRAKQITARPTQRRSERPGAPVKSDAKATDAIDSFWESRGQPLD